MTADEIVMALECTVKAKIMSAVLRNVVLLQICVLYLGGVHEHNGGLGIRVCSWQRVKPVTKAKAMLTHC